MKTTIRRLRQWIHEEVFRNYLWSAGFGGGGGGSDKVSGSNAPPGLGSPEDQEEELENGKEQTKNQIGARVNDRHPK